MPTFLGDARRRQLMTDLLGLGVPATIAVELCFLPNNEQAVDFEMAFRCKHTIDLAEQIAKVGESNLPKLFELSTFLTTDLLVLSAYKAEAVDRGSLRSFVHWMEAAQHLKVQ
jgi:hypothetical protein